jgi:hypothetical protein
MAFCHYVAQGQQVLPNTEGCDRLPIARGALRLAVWLLYLLMFNS